jgi:hypothetical protein
MPEPIRYNSAADLAALFGVKPGTIETWRSRHKDFPEPDAYVGRYAGWLPSREAELRAWEASRPGRGAGGGRPRTVKDEPQRAALPVAAKNEPESASDIMAALRSRRKAGA